MRVVHSSSDPLLFLIEDFITPAECACLLTMSKRVEESSGGCAGPALAVHDEQFTQEERELLANVEERIGVITGCPPHSDELPLLLLHKRPEPAAMPPAAATAAAAAAAVVATADSSGAAPLPKLRDLAQARYPAGIHLDTHAFPVRFASALLYLSTPTSGGQTVFPLGLQPPGGNGEMNASDGDDDPLKAASEKLIAGDVHHTRSSDDPALAAATRKLEAAALSAPSTTAPNDGSSAPTSGGKSMPSYATGAHALSVAAKAGNLVVFWTREADSTIAVRAWHGGEVVYRESSEDKWLLRKFKEIPAKVFHDSTSRIAFMAESHADAQRRLQSVVCGGSELGGG